MQHSVNWDVTIFYCRGDIFKYLYFPLTITDTSHIPSTIILTNYWLGMTKTEYVEYEIVLVNIG